MGMFVSGRVAITAAGVTDEKDITSETDVIYIRPKMDYGTRQKVIGAAAKFQQQPQGNRAARRAAKRAAREQQQQTVEFDVGGYQIALLVHNILAWAGPSFAGVACTESNIVKLDPDNELVQRVIQEISDRNVKQDAATDDDDAGDDDPNAIDLTPIASSSSTS